MRVISSFIFVVIISQLYGQNGFNVIRRAEKKIEQGKFEKAEKLLKKADSMSYGFCGNAWVEAKESIALNRVKIFDAKGEYLNAANTLNSVFYYYEKNVDSLKVMYFLKTLDKDFMKKEIDSCINLITSLDSDDFLNGIELNVSFSNSPFIISYNTLISIRKDMYLQTEDNKNTPFLDRFKGSLRRQPFYMLLLQ
jgi:tetratricopeptide (TPR) repeat protein